MAALRRKSFTPIAGRTAIISGAASGIGQALAVRLSSFGCPVAITDVNEEGLADTESRLTGPSLARRLDVSDRGEQLAFAAEVAEWLPAPIGAVFNNAGVALSTTVAEASVEDEEWLDSVNFRGVVNGVHAFLPLLLKQGDGAIVNTSSVFGLAGIPSQSAYCASKFAVRGYTEALRHELQGTGVRAVTIHPGGVKTNIVRNGRMRDDPLGLDRTPEQFADDFEAIARTTPEKAAETIHRGVDSGKARILIGADAHIFDAITRISPTHYYRVLDSLQTLARRRGEKQR